MTELHETSPERRAQQMLTVCILAFVFIAGVVSGYLAGAA